MEKKNAKTHENLRKVLKNTKNRKKPQKIEKKTQKNEKLEKHGKINANKSLSNAKNGEIYRKKT